MRQQLIERIETLHGQEAKLADLIVDAPNAAALVTKLKTVQAEREQAEAELTEEEQVARDLNTNTDLIDQLRDGRLTSWVEQKATHPETANARLKSILATPVAVVPEGEGRKRIWTFLGLSRLDGALVGQLNGDTVLVALQPGDGQVARLRVTLPERDAAALVAGWQTPISGGSDAPVSTGRGLTGGEQGRGPEWRRTPGALGAPWRSRGALDAGVGARLAWGASDHHRRLRMPRYIDLSVTVDDTTLSPPSTNMRLEVTPHRRGPGFWQVSSVRQSLHTGAHIDSPLHVFKDGITTAELRLDQVMGEAVVVDLSFVGANHEITVDDLRRGGADDVRSGDIVLLRTDWTDKMYGRWPDYFTQSPFFPPASAEWLVAKGPKNIGFDFFEEYCARLPEFTSEDFPMHRVILGAGVVIMEGLTNLGALPRRRVEFAAPFYKIAGTEGAPARFFATVDR